MRGGGNGRGNGRPLITACSNLGPSFQFCYFWAVVILMVIRISNVNVETKEILKFSIVATSVLWSLKDVCCVMAEVQSEVFLY